MMLKTWAYTYKYQMTKIMSLVSEDSVRANSDIWVNKEFFTA